jgi:hypothetical protein
MIRRVFANDVYRVNLFEYPPQLAHLANPPGWAAMTIVRSDEGAARDWRHLQSIKNEVAGPEREAVELYPAESRVLDEANATHIFLAPEGVRLPIGGLERSVARPGEPQPGGAHAQRGWQPGLPTG